VTQNSGTTGALISVHFPSKDTGYILGGIFSIGGIYLKTTDGGTNWTMKPWGPWPALMMSLFFTNTSTGYVVGYNTISKTTDGGENWEVHHLNPSVDGLNSVFFTNLNTGYIVGDYGTILKTIDGGANWMLQNSCTHHRLNSVYFTDENTGYAVGADGIIVKTNDGGGYPFGTNDYLSNSINLKIYPNPSSTQITIETSEIPTQSHISILNISGQQLLQQEIPEAITTIDVRTLPGGVYFLRVTGETGVQVGKFIKQK
jgi:hypothetical protein